MNEPSRRDAAARKQRRDLIGLWVFFLVWTGAAAGFFFIFAIKASSLGGALITGPMLLLGVYFMWRMTRLTADEAKFGVVSLTPLSAPACPGGRFEAVLQFHDRTLALTEIDAELRCIAVTIFRRSQSGVVPSEQVAWSSRKKIPLWNNRADLGFDIPGDAPVTNLPGERQSESGWHSLPMEPGKALQYHRWEIFVTAGVPGIDLERNFPVIVEPGRKSMAPKLAQALLKPAVVPLPTGPRIFRIGALTATIAYIIYSFVTTINRSEEREKQIAALPPAAMQKPPKQVRELLPQTPWTRDTQGWDLPMPAFSRAIGIAAKGIHSTREKDSERFVFDQILIEMNPAWSHMEYFDVMVSVSYFPADPNIAGTLGGFSTRLEDVRGHLTADVPAHGLRDLSVTVPLPKGEIGRTELTLGINAHINDPSSNSRNTHETSRKLVLERK